MQLNIHNVQKYIESTKGHQIFNIEYTDKELDVIRNFKISNFRNYNSYNTIENL